MAEPTPAEIEEFKRRFEDAARSHVPPPVVYERAPRLRRHTRTDLRAELSTVRQGIQFVPCECACHVPETAQRTQWSVWWYAGDPDSIRLIKAGLPSRAAAMEQGEARIGQDGITGFRVRYRQERDYPDGGVYIGPWINAGGTVDQKGKSTA